MEELISIIVPIYNVEKYLKKCIDSILNQTYKNLEIILVNDGSTDNSYSICNEYSKKDKRVIVVNKKNGGLSDARNHGLKVANGEYIGFVDSDDYINKHMYENLMRVMSTYYVDIVSCGIKKVYENDKENIEYQISHENVEIYSVEEALLSLIEEKDIKQTVWNKLYKKDVIEDIVFEVGKIHEDEYWSYQVIGNASKIAYLDTELYYYLQREGSIMSKPYSINRLNAIYSRKNRLSYLEDNFPNLVSQGKWSLFFTCIYQCQCLLNSKDIENIDDIYKIICSYAYSIDFNINDIRNLDIKQKIWFFMARLSLKYSCKIRNYLGVGF